MSSTTPTPASAAAHAWVAMWNREVPAESVVTADCVVWFGGRPLTQSEQEMTGPAALQGEVDFVHGRRPDIRYSTPTPPIESLDGFVTLLWNVSTAIGTRTGIDILVLDGDRVRGVRSITGELAMPEL